MRKNKWNWIMGGLFGVLLVVTTLLIAARKEVDSFPSIESTEPSGIKILADLLQEEGYKVRLDLSSRPKLQPKEVPIIFTLYDRDKLFADPTVPRPENASDPDPVPLNETFDAHSEKRGTSVWISLPRAFNDFSLKVEKEPIVVKSLFEPEQQKFKLVNSPLTPPIFANSEAFTTYITLAENPVVSLYAAENGAQIRIHDGLFLTNRFIDRQQNADFILHLFRTYVPRGSTLVFAEASFGNQDDRSLMAALGPWAQAIYAQLWVLFLALVYTLGTRFGLPELFRRQQLGAREMVEALGDAFMNGRQAGLATKLLAEDLDFQVKRALGLPLSATRQERDRQLPPDVAAALNLLEAGSPDLKEAQLAKQTQAQCDTIELWLVEKRGKKRQ